MAKIRSLWEAKQHREATEAALNLLKAEGDDALHRELDYLFGEDNAGAWITRCGTAFILKVRFSSYRLEISNNG